MKNKEYKATSPHDKVNQWESIIKYLQTRLKLSENSADIIDAVMSARRKRLIGYYQYLIRKQNDAIYLLTKTGHNN